MPDKPPLDAAAHAEEFARRYAEPLDHHSAQTMLDLGILPERIGAGDPEHGIRHAAFHAHGGIGGDVTPDGRIVIDSGVMNPDLLTALYGEEAGKLWASSRLKDRMQAIIAHEHSEHEAGGHEEALAQAPDTPMPVSPAAREILRAMERGWKGR